MAKPPKAGYGEVVQASHGVTPKRSAQLPPRHGREAVQSATRGVIADARRNGKSNRQSL